MQDDCYRVVCFSSNQADLGLHSLEVGQRTESNVPSDDQLWNLLFGFSMSDEWAGELCEGDRGHFKCYISPIKTRIEITPSNFRVLVNGLDLKLALSLSL